MEAKPKLKDLSNRELIEQYFKAIESEFNLHIIDVDFGDSYFVFDLGKDSVCNFHIKELKGFLFGIWTKGAVDLKQYPEAPEDSELVLFAQIEYAMDKFKPSRCALKCFAGRYVDVDQETQRDPNFNGDLDSLDWKEYWNLFDTDGLLTFMKKHKSVAEQVSYHSEYGFHCYESTLKAWYHCRKDRFIDNKYKFKKAVKFYFSIFKIKKILKKFKCSEILLYDYGEDYYPRVHIFIKENDDISKSDFNNNSNLIELLTDKYFLEADTHVIDSRVFNRRLESKDKILWKNF